MRPAIALLLFLVGCLADHTIYNVVGKYRVRAWPKRPLSAIKYLVVHQSEIRGNADDESVLRALQRIHVQGNGWAGVSYHYGIMKNGNIYQINGLDDRTNTDTKNVDAIAILLNGYFKAPFNEQPTAAQIDSLEFLLNTLMKQFGFTKSNIRGHRDRTSTDCPGEILYAIVQRYKANGVPAPSGPTTPVPNRLPAGRGCVQVDVNLRDNGRLRGNVITVVPQGTTGTIHPTAPLSEDGYVWYEVTMGANRGWMAESSKDKSTTFLKSCPANETAPQPGRDLIPGSEVCLTSTANQRSSPCGTIIASQVSGTRGTVLADPQNGMDSCSWNWYKVRIGTTEGWMAKGPWLGVCVGNAEYDPDGLDISVYSRLSPEERAGLAAEALAAVDEVSGASVVAFSLLALLLALL